MAVDMFLKIAGVTGESQDAKYKGNIDISSFSFGVTQPSTGHFGGGSGAGKAQFQDINLTKRIDKASPVLLEHLIRGTHFDSATIIVRKVGGKDPIEFFKIELSEVFISSVQNSGANQGDGIDEQISLNFSYIEYHYKEQSKDGSAGSASKTTWNIKKNAPDK
jgi:type VI secretion system secreted protein Hcp